MVVFHSIVSIRHEPPLSYLHGRKLGKEEEIEVGVGDKIMMV
jgi:hypothetical protein